MSASPAEPIDWQATGFDALPGQWITRFDGIDGPAEVQISALTQRLATAGLQGVTVSQSLGLPGMFTLGTAADISYEWVSDSLHEVEGFLYVQPDLLIDGNAVPNDPSFGQLWGLHNTGQVVNGSVGITDGDIDAPEAWNLTTGSSSVIVGVIDSGIDFTHPDLTSNIFVNPGEIPNNFLDDDANGFVDDYRGWDFYSNDNNPTDDNGHGTHVSGTIGASGNNGQGVVGINWDVTILPLKFLGSGNTGPLSAAVSAINYATMMRQRGHNIKVTNNSWGGPSFAPLADAITAHRNAGILFVAAAGNDSLNIDFSPSYPASYTHDNIITVAASNNRNQRAIFSNYGATSVDLAAPGDDILSTVPSFRSPSRYMLFDGTSMAAPHVAGAAALIWSVAPNATYQEVRQALLSTVDPLPAFSGVVATGGQLNVFRALQQFVAGPRVTGWSTSSTSTGAISSLTLTFNKAVDPVTFTLADISSFTGPGGVDLVNTITAVTPISTTQFRLDFTPVTAAGSYQIVVGPDIRDTSGNPMDQDNDSNTGEPIQDRATANFSIAAPRVLSTTPSGVQPGPVSSITLSFSKPIDTSSFTLADIASFTGPGGIDLVPAVTGITMVGAAQYRIDFTAQTVVGFYTLVVGPDVRDLLGNPLDQDNDGIIGESLQDQVSSSFSISAPRVSSSIGTPTASGAFSSYTFSFSKPIDPVTFTVEDVAVFTGPGGVDLRATISRVVALSSTSYRVDFAPQNAAGTYSLSIGPNIRDTAGNSLDQDLDGVLGEEPGDRYTTSFTISSPRISLATPTGTQPGPVTNLTFSFSKPIDPASFTADDVAVFTGPGGIDLRSTIIGIVPVGSTSVRVEFAAQGPAGNYTMSVGPQILDLLGNPLNQDFDQVAGEEVQDRFTTTFSVSAPRIIGSTIAAGSTLIGPLSSIALDFNKEIPVAGFTTASIASFTGPGGVDLQASISSITRLSPTKFQLSFSPVNIAGAYQLIVGPEIVDAVGNRLDQDSDGTPSEQMQDRFTLNFNLNQFGPEGFGYTASVSPYSPINLSLGQPSVFSILDGQEDAAVAVDLGANSFNFYGVTYSGSNQLFVSTNGLVTFGTGYTSGSNSGLTFSPNQATIAPFWDDLKTNATAQDRVLGKFEDTNSDGRVDRLIIEWSEVHDWATSGSGDGTFQLILQLNTGVQVSEFYFNYVDLDFGTSFTNNGSSATTGIKDVGSQSSGPNLLIVNNNSATNPFVGNGKAIKWSAGNTIRGQKFQDLDADGVKDIGEAGLGGWAVYADVNSNGSYDPQEPLTVTDLSGNYQLSNLLPGSYLVREIEQPGWVQTAPAEVFFTPLANGGFETGVFTPDWSVIGTTSVVNNFGAVKPTVGAYQALASNLSGSVSDTALANFMGRPATSLDALIGANAVEGSAIKRTFQATAGQKVTFDWNFFTNHFPNSAANNNDFSFASVRADSGIGTLQVLSSTVNTFVSPGSPFTFSNMTGFRTFSYIIPVDGVYTLVVGTADVGSSFSDSQVLVDNFQLTGGTNSAGRAYRELFTDAKTMVANRNFGNFWQGTDQRPIADAGGPYEVTEGGTIVLSAAGSHDLDHEAIVLYEWDFDYDGTTFDVDFSNPSSSASWVANGVDGATARIVALRVTEADGLVAYDTATILISNAPPAIVLDPIVAIDENGIATLTGTISDASPLDSFTVTVDWGDPGSTDNLQTFTFPANGSGVQTISLTHLFRDDKPSATVQDGFAVKVTATDDDGDSSTATEIAMVRDAAPTITLNPLTAINEGGGVVLTGTVTDIGTQDTFTLVIDWGDPDSPNNIETITLPARSNGTQTFSRFHQYHDDRPSGSLEPGFSILATVTDDDGLSDSDTEHVVVRNLPPSLFFVVSGGFEGGISTLSGTISDPGRQDSFVLTIDWGDPRSSNNIETFTIPASTTGSQSLNLTHRYLDDPPPGSPDQFVVIATLTDDDGASVASTRNVTIFNALPNIALNPIVAIDENGLATLTGSISDPGTMDSFTLQVNWGDPLSPENVETYTLNPSETGSQTFAFTHQYLDDNPSAGVDSRYLVSVQLADDDGGSWSDSEFVTVRDVAPVVEFDLVPVADENGLLTVTGTIVDAGTLDTFTLQIDWGDLASPDNLQTYSFAASATGSQTFTLTHRYLDDRPTGTTQESYLIKAVVRDDDGLSSTAEADAVISNVAPSVVLDAITNVTEGGLAILSGKFFDPGTLDTYTLVVDWGDPSSATNIQTFSIGSIAAMGQDFILTHQYRDDFPSGTSIDQRSVTVTVTDDDGAAGSAQQTATIENIAPKLESLAINTAIDENGLAKLIGSYTDVGSLDQHTLSIGWDDPNSPVNSTFALPAFSELSPEQQFTSLADGKVLIIEALDAATRRVTFSIKHIYRDDGLAPGNASASDTSQVVVTIRDDDSGEASAQTLIGVNNVAPTILTVSSTATMDSLGSEGSLVEVTALFADVGTLDTHSALIDWGDGVKTSATIAGGRAVGAHAYANGGIYAVRITLMDDDQGTAEIQTTAVVTGVGLVGGQLQIIGSTANDYVQAVVVGEGADAVVRVYASLSGDDQLSREFPLSSVESVLVLMYAGNDAVILTNDLSMPSRIEGGDGDDGIYAGAGDAVLHGGNGNDLLIGGRGSNLLSGGAGNDLLYAGGKGDIVLGGDGEDHLHGGSGRDLLIGGLGADLLNGNNHDDILISGTTDFDENDGALLAILGEWNSARSVSDRVANLRSGIGPVLAGTSYQLASGVTVLEDGDVDRLQGASGVDWFFASENDRITGKEEIAD